MTVRATLWKYKPRKDGSCNIKLYIQDNGKKRYEKTSYHAHPKDWDERRGRLKPSNPLARKINSILTQKEFQAKGELIGVNNSLISLIEDFLDDCRNGRVDLRPGTWSKFVSFLNHLRRYTAHRELQDISFADVTLAFYTDFTAYLRDNSVGRSGISNNVKHLKRFMQLGLDRELHTNVAFKAKAFYSERVQSNDKIYLSTDEIEALAALDLSDRPGFERERDRFLVSYYLILRFGDSLRISRGNITSHGNRHFYKNIAEKTGTVSFIPIKPAALAIIKKCDYDLSGETNQHANRQLKIIAAMAGITDNMASPGKPKVPKFNLVTTHTARRSAATNMLLSGVPLSEIMQLGGWKKEATLRQYLLAGGIKMAQLSAGRDFFQ